MSNRQQGRRRRARPYVAALILALVALALAAPASGAVPAKFWGVAPQAQPSEEQFQRLKRGGVDSLRFPVDWSAIESVEGEANWGYVDAMVGGVTKSGIEGLPFITGAPNWAVKQVSVNRASHSFAPDHLPVRTGAERSAWEGFLRKVVNRYRPGGTFWAEHPELSERPLRTWQIWNEPNFKYFVARPNPVEYGKLVKFSYPAIKGVDPGAQLILAGLFAEPGEAEDKKLHPRPAYFATEFLRQMYRKTRGIKRDFSGVSLHPYTTSYQRLTPEIENVRKVLREVGDGGKSLWITELGWSSGPPKANNAFAKGPQGQVAQLKGAFKLLEKQQAKWKIKRIFWFSVDDAPGACNFCDGSGLFRKGFVAKPSWKAYVKFAGGTP